MTVTERASAERDLDRNTRRHAGRTSDRNDIAIIGIGCRYPGVHGPLAFWDLIRSDRCTVSDVPRERVALGYDIDRYLDRRLRVPGRISSPYAGFLEQPDRFDPAPFGLTHRDVRAMEPQQRLMLEVTWDAITDAGIPIDSLHGERVAVMLGHMAEDYSRERIAVLGEETVNRGLDVFTVAGMSRAVLSGRIAFLLGVTGPSFTLDTACSSSLIATHLACQSLWSGEAKLALAGGVNLFLTPEGNIALSRSGMLSPDGRCKAFDAGANGFVRAEGAGVVLLRPLRDALASDDPIYAVIRGTGISSDGRDGGHMMAPGRKGQAQAMRDAYARADVSPADVDFVETHGTGTVIGDPVEIGALADVMGPGRPADRPLRVSSIKGHIGHSESASGVAGLICAALSLAHRELPAQLHFETPSPHIPWDEIPVRVQTEQAPWPGEGPRLAGVNSFGISGTNAHVVLESAPPPGTSLGERDDADPDGPLVFPLSAHDAGALEQSARDLEARLRGPEPLALRDLAHTLGRRRQHCAHRFAAVADSRESLAEEIAGHLAGRSSGTSAHGIATTHAERELVLVFPGQGAQSAGMGQTLFAEEPVFRASIEALDAAYERHADWSLVDALREPERVGTLRRLSRLQPTLVAVEIALADLWAHWGVVPDAVVGQSMGEIAAAHRAGALDLDAVARLACHRGTIVERAAGRGAMAIVGLGEDELAPLLRSFAGRLELAGSSSPMSTIVSGDREPTRALVDQLEARDVFARLLDVDFASHCFHMDPLLDAFRAGLDDLAHSATRLPLYSTVERGPIEGEGLGAEYWVKNLRAPVGFAATLERLIADGARQFVEVSPHPTLARAIPETAATVGTAVHYVPSLTRGREERACLRAGLARLFVHGAPIDFDHAAPAGQVLRSAPYPYQRRRFWFGTRTRADVSKPSHELLGERIEVASDTSTTLWQRTLDLDACPFLEDHRVEGRASLPAALYIEIALTVAQRTWPDAPVKVRDLGIWPALALDARGRATLQVALRRNGPRAGQLSVMSRDANGTSWSKRAACELVAAPESSTEADYALADSGGCARAAASPVGLSVDDWHTASAQRGVAFGRRMRTLSDLSRSDAGGQPAFEARLALPRIAESESHAYRAHPALLEPCLTLSGPADQASSACSVDEIQLFDQLPSEISCQVTSGTDAGVGVGTPAGGRGADVRLCDADGRLLATLRGIRTRQIGRRAARLDACPVALHPVTWRRLTAPEDIDRAAAGEWLLAGDDRDAVSALATELSKLGASCSRHGVDDEAPMSLDADASRDVVLLVHTDAAATAVTAAQARVRLDALVEELAAEGTVPRTAWLIALDEAPFGELPNDATAPDVTALAASSDTGPRPAPARLVVSLDAADCDRALGQVAAWLAAGYREPTVAWRDGAFWAPRATEDVTLGAVPAAEHERSAGARGFAARITAPGEPEGVALIEEPVREPEADEVRVDVEAAALPRALVDQVLGLPGPPRSATDPHPSARGPGARLDTQVVGIVRALGPGVRDLAIGDRVAAQGPAARHVCLRASEVVRIPSVLDAATAAGHVYALGAAQVLHGTRDDSDGPRTTFVYGGDSDIGAAVIELARLAGDRVIVGAVSGERAASLRDAGIRVLASDRSTELTERLLDETDHAGVDEVINLEARLPIDGSLRAIRPGGRLVDGYARGASEAGPVEGLRITGGRSVQAVSLVGSPLGACRHDGLSADVLVRAVARLAESSVALPRPVPFAVAEIERALRYLGQGRAPGPVVVHFRDAAETPIRAADGLPRLFEAEGRYAVVCEVSEAAHSVATWMRDRGAGEVFVLPEAGPHDDDMGAREGLRGVLVVDRALATQMLEGAPSPEWVGAEASLPALAAITSTHAADFFLHVRAVTPGLGGARARPPGEPASALPGLLCVRRNAGLPTATLYVAPPSHITAVLEAVEAAVRAPETALPRLALGRASAEANDYLASALFAELAPGDADCAGPSVLREELSRLSGSQLGDRVLAALGDAVAVVTGLGEADRAQLRLDASLSELGLDSLMCLELAIGLQRDLGVELERGALGPGQSLQSIAGALAGQLGSAPAGPPA